MSGVVLLIGTVGGTKLVLGLLKAYLFDERDAPEQMCVTSAVCDALMHSLADRVRVARAALDLSDNVR